MNRQWRVGRGLKVVLITGAALLWGQAIYAVETDLGMSGTVGRYPVAMQLRMRDGNDIEQAHYSYASKGVAIPLTVRVDASALTLSEPGGGVFHLHLVGPSYRGETPSDIADAIGLEGDWRKAGTVLPVRLRIEASEDAASNVPDCAYYPGPQTSPASAGMPFFPDGGCTHTPDKQVLDRCIRAAYTTDRATEQCITDAMRPCRQDQADFNRCIGNVGDYLDQVIRSELQKAKHIADLVDAEAYHAWQLAHMSRCEQRSPFDPSGSGYNGDIGVCMARAKLALLQRNRMPGSQVER